MFDPVPPDGLIIRESKAAPWALRQLAYRDPERFPVLFDGAADGALSRYSVLAAYPTKTLWCSPDGRTHGTAGLETAPPAGALADAGFLRALERAWCRERRPCAAAGTTSLPFRGGWVVFLGYELAGEIEPRLRLPLPRHEAAGAAPAAFALRVPAGLVYDHAESRAWMFAEGSASACLPEFEDALASVTAHGYGGQAPNVRVHEEAPERFQSRVETAQQYIAAGEIYQANLSRPWRAELPDIGSSVDAGCALYERLRSVNPAPFAALAQFQGWQLLSSSPERLVRVTGNRVETRPIAGTRPRSGVDGRHGREVAGLIAHPKERAEHVMLIDLERNDLGRICRAGTVRPDEFMVVESYAHVHHIVSNVCGELRSDLTPVDVLRAVFPGGTITGCPKFRCMQIIAELEGEARQAYTGALGYLNLDGSMDFNILIRSLTQHRGQIEFRTGAGIVADSDWRRELAETRTKARGMLRGLRADHWDPGYQA